MRVLLTETPKYQDFLENSDLESEMNGHEHDIGHEFVSESVSEADSDTGFFLTRENFNFGSESGTRFLRTSDTDSDMESDKVTTSDTGMSEDLGRGHTSDTRVRLSLPRISKIRGNIKFFSFAFGAGKL